MNNKTFIDRIMSFLLTLLLLLFTLFLYLIPIFIAVTVVLWIFSTISTIIFNWVLVFKISLILLFIRIIINEIKGD